MPCWNPPRRLLKYVILPALCVLMLCGGCSGEEAPSDDVVVDSLHADLLIDLHLADARAEVTGESAESLRSEALAAHGLDSLELSALLEQYSEHPETAVALFERAAEQLSTEQRGR